MFGINKNGTKEKIGILLPATYPSIKVTYGSGTVKDALDDTVSKANGGTFNGRIYVNQKNGTTETVGESILGIGNNLAEGVDQNSLGVLHIYSKTGKVARIRASATQTANRDIYFPDASGTIALTSDIPTVPTKVSQLTNDSGFITSSSVPTKVSQLTNDSGFITSSGSCSYATSAGSAAPSAGSTNYMQVRQNESSLNELAKHYYACGMISNATDNPTGSGKWVHAISMAWTNGVNDSWVSQLALGVQDGDGVWYRTNSGTVVGRSWKKLLQESDATTTATASKLVKRDGSGYIYGVYYNASCGSESITSYSSPYAAFFSTDGWLRKCSLANFKSALSMSTFTDNNWGNCRKWDFNPGKESCTIRITVPQTAYLGISFIVFTRYDVVALVVTTDSTGRLVNGSAKGLLNNDNPTMMFGRNIQYVDVQFSNWNTLMIMGGINSTSATISVL